ncbi:MAG: glycosyltransferase involved in cell wall biosynthesis [Psychroserpens sp.]
MKVYHFHNGRGGGVLSVIRNILLFQQNSDIENHVIHTVNKDLIRKFNTLSLKGAKTEQVYYYSSNWNFYYTCKQLAKLLPDEDSVIVAHDLLELGMVSNLGLQNPVVQVLHGDFDYYYELARLHEDNIDTHICVSNVIAKKLRQHINSNAIIRYLRFPVPKVLDIKYKVDKILNCAFFVRDLTDERKGVNLLPKIEKLLLENDVRINWHIAGGGMNKQDLVNSWGEFFSERIIFWGELNRKGIDNMLRKCNVMILPSYAEGLPVAVVEGMKYGLVPIIPSWDGAVEELVINNKTGFFCDVKDVNSFAEKIIYLNKYRSILQEMSLDARVYSNSLFDPHNNTRAYEAEFKNAALNKKSKIQFQSYGSRLDKSWIPNVLVDKIRKLTKNK